LARRLYLGRRPGRPRLSRFQGRIANGAARMGSRGEAGL
jgi:hypothetical protein